MECALEDVHACDSSGVLSIERAAEVWARIQTDAGPGQALGSHLPKNVRAVTTLQPTLETAQSENNANEVHKKVIAEMSIFFV